MKKIILALLVFIFSSLGIIAQSINLPADSVANLLCKKWEMNYVEFNGMKVEKPPGGPEMNYEFKKDKTFIMTSTGKDASKGTWSYDPKQKIVKLIRNGKSNTTVIELRPTELVMFMDTREATPDDPLKLKTYFKPRS